MIYYKIIPVIIYPSTASRLEEEQRGKAIGGTRNLTKSAHPSWNLYSASRSSPAQATRGTLVICFSCVNKPPCTLDRLYLHAITPRTSCNLVGIFYVQNVVLVLKSKVKSWSWFWSWSSTGFRFWQKLCSTLPNSVGAFNIWSITFCSQISCWNPDHDHDPDFAKKLAEKSLRNKSKFHE